MSKEPKELNSWSEIIGRLIDGFGTKIIVAGIAIWLASEVYDALTSVAAPITTAMGAQ